MAFSRAQIRNEHLVTDVYGKWPSFHDSELHDVFLERTGSTDVGGPDLRMRCHVFEVTKDVDEQGYFVLVKHRLVTLLFTGVENLKFEGFNHQNVIEDLSISDITVRQWEALHFEVELEPAHGAFMTFFCCEVVVEEVENHEPQWLGGHPRGTRSPPRPL